jgi:DNA-cytosine methyltransferase
MPLTYGSLFTGIAGFDKGFEAAGMQCLWQVEIDDTCNRVLRRKYPDVERHRDVARCGRHNLRPVDVICGGFPCQDVSLAGLRAGLAGARSGLWREFLRILGELRPRLCVIENVPGLLSSWTPVESPPGDLQAGDEWETEESSDFETILLDLCELDYCLATGVLDSQYFRVPQRRDRVFIVGSLGDGSRLAGAAPGNGGGLLGLSAQILFESESVRGDSPPSCGAGSRVAGTVTPSALDGSSPCGGDGREGMLVTTNRMVAFGEYVDDGTASTLKERDYKDATDLIVSAPKDVHGYVNPRILRNSKSSNQTGIKDGELSDALCSDGPGAVAVAFKPSHYTRGKDGEPSEVYPPLSADADKGDQDPIIFAQNQRDEVRQMEVAGASGSVRRGDAKNETVLAYRTSGNTGAFEQGDKISALNCGTDKNQHVIAFQPRIGRNGRGQPEDDISPALAGADAGATSDMRPCVAFTQRTRNGAKQVETQDQLAYALTNPGEGGRADEKCVQDGMIVRRLTPRECERLQGFEDDFTAFDDEGKPISDSARYRMCGNAVTSYVAEWLGLRIVAVLSTTPR